MLYISIIVFKLHYKMLPIFEALFNKRQTLESRYMLWNLCINYISKSPIIGYGIQTIEVLKTKFIVSHAHNMFLQFTYESGLIGLFLYLTLFFIVGRSIYKCKNKQISKISAFTVLILLLLGIFDTLNHAYIFLLLFIIYKISGILNKNIDVIR